MATNDLDSSLIVNTQQIITTKSFNDVVNDIIYRLATTQTEITDFNPGSVARSFIEAISYEIGTSDTESQNLYIQLNNVYNSAFVDLATGQSLDYVVSVLGIVRNPAKKATGYITFKRSTPASFDISIPQGTIVSTRPVIGETPIQFSTDIPATLPAGQTSVTVPITALKGGSSGNLSSNTLTFMSTPPYGIETCTNLQPTSGGVDKESDDSLRQRAKHALETAGRGTSNAIKYAVLSVSGIRDCMVMDMKRGIGTIDVMVVGDSYPLNTSILQEVYDKVMEYKAAGIDARIVVPETIFIDVGVTATLSVQPGYEETQVINSVISNISSYINTLKLGEDVLRNKILAAIMNTDGVLDATLTSPSSNIVITDTQIAKAGTITIKVTKYMDRGIQLTVE
jgi:uncharacterized phage protein gp47/JayE